MRKYIILTLVVALGSGCAHKNSSTDQALVGREPGQYRDLDSFRLSDVEPEVADQELETIPVEINPQVEKWIAYFQGRGAVHMERYLARSTRYEKLMKKVLRDNGVPEDLFYIALIESGFSARATSHASAVGYWQFIRGTGKRYGLEISAFVDERRDPILATEAAAEYFKGLYSVFGSWYLAMASYNVGENRVKREVMKHKTRDFWHLVHKKALPKETLNYVPKYIAAKIIAKNPAKFGFADIDYMPPIEFDHVNLSQPVNMRVMADKMGINYEDFKALNPKFKGEIAPLDKEENDLVLRVPPSMSEAALVAASQSVVDKVEFVADSGDTKPYRIRRGESLYTIARKYRTTVAYLRDLNDIPRGKKLKIGRTIYVPDRDPVSNRKVKTVAATSVKGKKSRNIASTNSKFYIVQSGDSLSTIARKYSTSVSELKRLNNLSRGSMIRSGVKIRVPASASNSENSRRSGSSMISKRKKYHVVRRGENLHQIADKYNVSVGDLKRKNSIRNPSKLFVGAKIMIPAATAAD